MSEPTTAAAIRHADLCSGIGGFALAAKWVGGIETVVFCEIDTWAQKILNKNFAGIPIHDDLKTLSLKNYGPIDIITCGYPCQPFSSSGEREGENDYRHLWPTLFGIIKGSRPRMVLCENVAGHVNMGLDEVLSDLESEGYSAQPIIIPACAVGAPHRRDRVWIIAYANGIGSQVDISEDRLDSQKKKDREANGSVFDPSDARFNRFGNSKQIRAGDGIPNRSHRIKGLGNAIVPQVAAEILRVMMAVDNQTTNN